MFNRELFVMFKKISLFLSLSAIAVAQPTNVYHICSNTTTFAGNSPYKSNLATVLTSLSTNTHLQDGFYRYSFGDGPDQVYGVSQCTGGLSPATCQDCVANMTQDILRLCPNQKTPVAWYDGCLLHYSNENIFSVMATFPTMYVWNMQNMTGVEGFDEILARAMTETTTNASASWKGATKFAVKDTNLTAFWTLYTLAQCTSDLTADDCRECLLTSVSRLPDCCGGKQGGRVLTPSCNIRYEIYPFYNATGYKPESNPFVNNTGVNVVGDFPSSPLPPSSSPSTKLQGGSTGGLSAATIVVIVASISIFVLLFCVCSIFLRRRAMRKYNVLRGDHTGISEITTVESLQFSLDTIQEATNKFSKDHKLGEGGFGEVYKGTLPNGQNIAVKKLSKDSAQGSKEFKNEVLLLAKLLHRNLVRLLGFCLEGREKILVYEYVPNKSLDFFLFDEEKRRELDWSMRYKIIGGIARGILYLHEDSRLRIIHRDLKPSNILLDIEMNAKISDFGMARMFVVDQTQATTNRIVGTFGYMSPEYAMLGQFSVKSDMYSFGVLVLEIICGKKNSSFYQTNGVHDLVNFVWNHWREGTPLEVLDPVVADSYSREEVLRCIQIGLLCVQEDAANRPTMATVVLMLDSYSVTVPMPRQPAFLLHGRSEESWPSVKSVPGSVDESSITQVSPR